MKKRSEFATKTIKTCAVTMLLVLICGMMPCGVFADDAGLTELSGDDYQTYTAVSAAGDSAADEDLLAGYMTERLKEDGQPADNDPNQKGSAGTLRTSSRINSLNEEEAKLYTILKDWIEHIAAGSKFDDVPSGKYIAEQYSSVIKVPLDSIFGEETFRRYTAAELGVSKISVNGDITDEAKTALRSRYSVDLKRVYDALLTDLPYELYWHDKTIGIKPYIAAKYYSILEGGTEYLYFKKNDDNNTDNVPVMEIRFCVSQDYKAEGDATNTKLTQDISRVSPALTKAKAILTKYAGETDLGKLNSYRKEICDLTYYEFDSDKMNYGDPWQMIYVFDGDLNTKVVCEGYSKAFQFLCDNTSFSSSMIECYTIIGSMSVPEDFENYIENSKNPIGKHMWNIVRMNDGEYYLADLTNCDPTTGSGAALGSPDKLFLKGYRKGSVSDGYDYLNIPIYGSLHYSYDYYQVVKETGERIIVPGISLGLFTKSELTMSAKDYVCPHNDEDWTVGDDEVRTCKVCGYRDTDDNDEETKPVHVPTKEELAPNYTPSKVTLNKPTAGKNKVTVSWKRLAKKTAYYQIQIRNRKTGKVVKTVNVKQSSKKTIKKTIKGLKRKTSYKFRIRAYNKARGYTFYGKWSGYKNFKTR